MEATIQKIFEAGYDAYQETRRLPRHVRDAAHSIMVCRTSVLGGHVQSCPDGHFNRIWYNSCKHRMCPQCAFIQIERWLEKQKARLLWCDHYHVIFTISDKLRFLWRLNKQIMTDILFTSAADTLFELLGDNKYLGAKPGIIASLHTWDKTLLLHPHLHCLVTGGGLTDSREWSTVTGGYLLPFRVVRKLFRGKILARIRKALRAGKLTLPGEMSPRQLENLLNKLGRRKWNVRLQERYTHGNGVLTYIARYLRGGPISNKRIISCKDGEVTFNYGREKRALMTLPIDRFIGRFLQHVPQPRAVYVRYYGLYHSVRKEDLALCRKMIGQPPVEEPEFLDWQTYCAGHVNDHPELCPICGKRLVLTRLLPPLTVSEYPENPQPLQAFYDASG